jgi:hypothetical protein
MTPSARPASGASGVVSMRRRATSSSARWTSSSRNRSAAVTAASARWRAKRLALPSSASHPASLGTTRAVRTRSAMMSGVRKLVWTKSPRVSPNWSFRSGMTAVCGIGTPAGCRNNAVTANQSANPPTIAAPTPAIA